MSDCSCFGKLDEDRRSATTSDILNDSTLELTGRRFRREQDAFIFEATSRAVTWRYVGLRTISFTRCVHNRVKEENVTQMKKKEN